MPKENKAGQPPRRHNAENGNPIRQIQVTNGCRYYQVELRQSSSGRPVRKNFTSARKAYAFASRAMSGKSCKSSKSLGPIDLQREAQEILNPYHVSISEAARYFAEQHRPVDPKRRTETLVHRFIEHKQRLADRQKLQASSLVDIRHFLKGFVEALGEQAVDAVTAGEIDHFLDTVKGAANRRSHRLYISAFFNWAAANGWVDENPVHKTRRMPPRQQAPEVYHPDDVQRLMEAADADLLPYLALSFFSGARATEILQLTWDDVDFEQARIGVDADIAHGAKARFIELQPNLSTFLAPFRGRSQERIVPHHQRSLQRWSRKLHKELGIKAIYQGARHSFTAYHLALHPLSRTMQETGCSKSDTLYKYYQGGNLRISRLAQVYFGIMPSGRNQIIPLRKEAA